MTDFAIRDRVYKTTPRVFMMVGFSRTGKSRWANKWIMEHFPTVIVSGDDIRRSFGIEFKDELEPLVKTIKHYMVRSLLIRGQNVIVDDPHLTRKSRQELAKAVSELGQITVVEVERPSERDFAKWRKACKKDGFPWDVIENQLRIYEPVSLTHYDGYIHVDPRSF